MNKNGRALVFPRPLLPEVKKREDFGRTGAYLLQRPREDGEGKLLYISDEPDTAGLYESRHGAESLPCRSDAFHYFVVAGRYGPAMLVRQKTRKSRARISHKLSASGNHLLPGGLLLSVQSEHRC